MWFPGSVRLMAADLRFRFLFGSILVSAPTSTSLVGEALQNADRAKHVSEVSTGQSQPWVAYQVARLSDTATPFPGSPASSAASVDQKHRPLELLPKTCLPGGASKPKHFLQ